MSASPWESLLAHFLPLRHFSKRNVPYSESPTHSVSYFIWERIYWRVLPTTCGLNFHSLLPISTFLLFLSPSEHSTQYAAEIIFCWMKFGHKSRADLLRPLHSLFPSLLSTWQFKSLITLTHNPFPAGQSGPEMSTPPAHEPWGTLFWARAHGASSPRPRSVQCFQGWSRSSHIHTAFFHLPLPPKGSLLSHCHTLPLHLY